MGAGALWCLLGSMGRLSGLVQCSYTGCCSSATTAAWLLGSLSPRHRFGAGVWGSCKASVPPPAGLSLGNWCVAQVNTDFGSIFSMLLPGTTAQLQPPEGTSFLQGGCFTLLPAGPLSCSAVCYV